MVDLHSSLPFKPQAHSRRAPCAMRLAQVGTSACWCKDVCSTGKRFHARRKAQVASRTPIPHSGAEAPCSRPKTQDARPAERKPQDASPFFGVRLAPCALRCTRTSGHWRGGGYSIAKRFHARRKAQAAGRKPALGLRLAPCGCFPRSGKLLTIRAHTGLDPRGSACTAGAGHGLQNRWAVRKTCSRWVRFPCTSALSGECKPLES